MAVTGLGNVPKNRRLDTTAEHGAALAAYWPEYAVPCPRLNHVRVGASSMAALAWILAGALM